MSLRISSLTLYFGNGFWCANEKNPLIFLERKTRDISESILQFMLMTLWHIWVPWNWKWGVFEYFYIDCTIFIRTDKRHCRKDYSLERLAVIFHGSARVQYNKVCMNLKLQRAVDLYCSYCKLAIKLGKNWS